ncbi:phosphotransferase [Actinopolymorpha sp. B9G3]|uniref:phosphotransferase n=1 Tax=Actinopolymorpha sp. B9G3 TaxID=3158970 RepID=UPI0032D9A0ED
MSDRERGILADVVTAFGLGELSTVEPVTTGTMNRNWRVSTPAGVYAVKQLLDVGADQARRHHAATSALAAKGFPVPGPAALADGDTLLEHPAGLFAVSAWAAGVHRAGSELDLARCEALGRVLGDVHVLLASVLPAAPPLVLADTKDPGVVCEAIDRYVALIDGRRSRGEGDDFDERARGLLLTRRASIEAQVCRRPDDAARVGPAGWIHGDFQQYNVLWDGGRVSAVLDWDRMRVGVLPSEVVRAAVYIFSHADGHCVDLDRVAAFVRGYRAVEPVDAVAFADAVHRWWWNQLCALWQLSRHYELGDLRCDRFFFSESALLSWWEHHADDVRDAFAS